MTERALTDEQKRAVLDRIYAAWTSNDNIRKQRLTQLVWNALMTMDDPTQIYNLEDGDLASRIEHFARSQS